MDDRDALYFHFANLGLVIIGISSIEKAFDPVITALLILGSIGGFLFSWHVRNSRPPNIDTFIGMLSLASVVIVLSRLYESAINFETMLEIFSIALVWLSLFQTFGLKAQKSYSLLQIISVSLLICSVALALENENIYILYLAAFLFLFIFTMRLDLMCKKKNRGSVIIGDSDEVMSLWHQIKVGAIMFSIILTLSALVYPAVPRFKDLSLTWIPSTLLGLLESNPILKLARSADKTLKQAKTKETQMVDSNVKKRETAASKLGDNKEDKKEKKEEKTERFNASDFNRDIDASKVESLEIRTNKSELPFDRQALIVAKIKMIDGSVIFATNFVDWKVAGTGKIAIGKNGTIFPREEGYVRISAVYMGVFSNDVYIKITGAVKPDKKKKEGVLFYISILLLWLLALALVIFSIRAFIRSRKLIKMSKNNPKEFIKEVYYTLRAAFKIYGILKISYVTHREFYGAAKELVSARPGPMQALTEEFLEARFSNHVIYVRNSQKAIQLFREVKNVVLEKEGQNKFWKGFIFRLYVFDISLVRIA